MVDGFPFVLHRIYPAQTFNDTDFRLKKYIDFCISPLWRRTYAGGCYRIEKKKTFIKMTILIINIFHGSRYPLIVNVKFWIFFCFCSFLLWVWSAVFRLLSVYIFSPFFVVVVVEKSPVRMRNQERNECMNWWKTLTNCLLPD